MESDRIEDFVNWQQMWGQFQSNVQEDKAQALCKGWGITREAVSWLGVGWDGAKRAWIFAERDNEGEIVGLTCCAAESDGTPKKKKKWAITGSKRGLTYAPCPEWGGVPTYIDHPIPIPEGPSDVLAALSIEMYAIGRPSATGTAESNAWLQKAVKDRDIALVMEYDKGAGMVSVLEHGKRLMGHAKSVRLLEPAKGCKDLREWVQTDFAVDEISFQLERKPFEMGVLSALAGDVLQSKDPVDVARSFVAEVHNRTGRPTLRRWNKRWMHWNGSAYGERDEEVLRADMYDYLDGKQILVPPKSGNPDAQWVEKPYAPNRSKVSDVIDAVRGDKGVLLDNDTAMPRWLEQSPDLPPVEDLIVFKNGVLDVAEYAKTGSPRFLPHTPLLFTANYCPYDFNPNMLPWAKEYIGWLYSTTGDEDVVQQHREWGGYCMTNSNRFEKFMFMYGRPGGGKGTCMEMMGMVIGSNNIYSMKLSSLGDGYSLYSTIGKTNIFMPDTQATSFERASEALEIIKTVTGRGSIDVAGKNIQARSYRLNTRFTIVSNDLPNLRDSALALRRRMLVTPFPNSYADKPDTTLKDKFSDPRIRQGVAVWYIGGYINLLNRGHFVEPAASQQIIADFEDTNNPLAGFLRENCILEEAARVAKKTMYESYRAWCGNTGDRPMREAQFKTRFPMMNPKIGRTKGKLGEFTTDPTKRVQIYTGVRLRGPMDV